MKNYEMRSITITDIPIMADLLIGRQNLESKVSLPNWHCTVVDTAKA